MLQWLSNLHYWAVLALLDLCFQTRGKINLQSARDHMTSGLRPLGIALAKLRQGLPFDRLSLGYAPGFTEKDSATFLIGLLEELKIWQVKISATIPGYDPSLAELTAAQLRQAFP
jgi:hypothetical protein